MGNKIDVLQVSLAAKPHCHGTFANLSVLFRLVLTRANCIEYFAFKQCYYLRFAIGHCSHLLPIMLDGFIVLTPIDLLCSRIVYSCR